MDSPRGSTLTNMLMMLPMVVVPTVALLQMPENEGSLLSKLVSAATGDAESPGSESDPSAAASADDIWSAIEGTSPSAEDGVEESMGAFGDELDVPFETQEKLLSPFADAASSPFQQENRPQQQPPPAQGIPVADGPRMTPVSVTGSLQLSELLQQVSNLGANKTMWFGPGGGQFGFIAFVSAGSDSVSYRFEAISTSPEAAVAEVVGRIQQWRQRSSQ